MIPPNQPPTPARYDAERDRKKPTRFKALLRLALVPSFALGAGASLVGVACTTGARGLLISEEESIFRLLLLPTKYDVVDGVVFISGSYHCAKRVE